MNLIVNTYYTIKNSDTKKFIKENISIIGIVELFCHEKENKRYEYFFFEND